MICFQRHDEIKTVFEFFFCHVELAVFDDSLAILSLQIECHEDCAVKFAECQRIVLIAELLLECLACCAKLFKSCRNCDACIVKCCLVPIQCTSCHSNRNTCDTALDVLELCKAVFAPLCKVENCGNLVEIKEYASVAVELVDPALVDLVNICCCAALELKSSCSFPIRPCTEVNFYGDARIFLHECLYSLLCSFMS